MTIRKIGSEIERTWSPVINDRLWWASGDGTPDSSTSPSCFPVESSRVPLSSLAQQYMARPDSAKVSSGEETETVLYSRQTVHQMEE